MGGDEARLVDRLRLNDSDAMAVLYDRYGRLAFGLAQRIVGEAEAEDVVQEAFLTLWRNADRFDSERGSLRTFLLTIVHRRAIDVVRRRTSRPEQTMELWELLPAEGGHAPDELAALADDRRRIRAALSDLPEAQKEAVELTYFGGLTVAEMAERANIPLGTAKSRLRLALERLRQTIRER